MRDNQCRVVVVGIIFLIMLCFFFEHKALDKKISIRKAADLVDYNDAATLRLAKAYTKEWITDAKVRFDQIVKDYKFAVEERIKGWVPRVKAQEDESKVLRDRIMDNEKSYETERNSLIKRINELERSDANLRKLHKGVDPSKHVIKDKCPCK